MGKWIESNDKKIYVEEYIPQDEKEKVPVIIFSHGFNGSGDDFKQECSKLMEKGIAGICLDFCGGAKQSRSSGETTEMSLLTEKEDLLTVLDYVRGLSAVDKNRIFLFGGSQGGMVSALVAEEKADCIAGLILMYPALCIPDDWQKRFPKLSDMPDSVDLWDVSLGRVYYETIHDWKIWEMVGKYDKPVMIIHGDKDDMVPIDYARKAANLYPKAYYKEMPGEGHGFTEQGMEQVTAMAEAFVKAKEVFEVYVNLTGNETVSAKECKVHFLPFSGNAEGEYFQGEILQGGVDTQTEDMTGTHLSARYILQGKDKTGNNCRIFLQNEGVLASYGITTTKAIAVTDSSYLEGWNKSGLYGALLSAKDKNAELVIKFYSLNENAK